MSPFTCSAVITSGKLWGALGVRTRRAGFMGIRPSRERKRNSERTALLRGVAFVVQGEQAVEGLTSCRFRDGVADALFCLVKVVAEVEVGPAVRSSDGVVHLDVQLAQLFNVCTSLQLVVEVVINSREPLLSRQH